jgi:hypothetical protein
MKTEKYVLSVICVGVCLYAAKMVVGVIGLARYQGPGALLALLEVATFLGAGLIPLIFLWQADKKMRKALYVVWMVCIAYVSLLAINTLRLGLFTAGAIHLSVWVAIVVLLVRALREKYKHT